MFLVGAVFTEFSLLEGSRARISANRSACFCDFAVVLPSATFPCKPLNFRLFLFCIDLFWGFFLLQEDIERAIYLFLLLFNPKNLNSFHTRRGYVTPELTVFVCS